MKRAERAILIGLDSATLPLLDRYVGEGRCPNLGRLMERGVTTEAYSSQARQQPCGWSMFSILAARFFTSSSKCANSRASLPRLTSASD